MIFLIDDRNNFIFLFKEKSLYQFPQNIERAIDGKFSIKL